MSKLFFDIGANIGEYSFIAIQRGYEVVSVEANPGLIRQLDKKVPSQTVLNKAASSESGKDITLYIHSKNSLSTVEKKWKQRGRFSWRGVYADVGTWVKEVQVPTVTLDELIEEYGVPETIKVDVEEHELDVIRGLSAKVDHLTFQWHQESIDNVELILKHLSSIGFTEFGSITINNDGEQYFQKPPEYTKSIDDIVTLISSMDKEEWNWGMIWCK